MINKIWADNLIKVLDYENKLYRQLLTLAESKTGIIINGELESLQNLIGKEQKLTNDLSKLNDVRERIIEQIAAGLGKNPKELKLSELEGMLPDDQAGMLNSARNKLKDVIGKLTAKNDLNQNLIRNALDYVDFTLNLITRPVPQTAQYGRKGNETETLSSGVLDIRY